MHSNLKMLICPLCDSAQIETIDSLSMDKVKTLWKRLGHEFSQGAMGSANLDDSVVLHRCAVCGFAFFDPSLAGNEKFYRELEHENYFSSSRPEFARTLEFARQNKLTRILDVGCGSGTFLDLAKASGHDVCGIELNKIAAEKTRRKGHVVFEELLKQLHQKKTGGPFDLITFFQVLEHVSNPVATMREAAAMLRPEGVISVAVPSAEGIYRLAPYDPHQWPPHHLSRWRLNDLKQLSKAIPMKLVKSGGDTLMGSQIQHFWNLHNLLASIVGASPRWGGKVLPEMASLFYRKTGMKFFFPEWGNSIYGYFKKT